MEDNNFFNFEELLGVVLPEQPILEDEETIIPLDLDKEDNVKNTIFDVDIETALRDIASERTSTRHEASAIIRNSILAADAAKEPTSFFTFIHTFNKPGLCRKNLNDFHKIEMALMAKTSFTKFEQREKVLPQDARTWVDRAFIKRAFSSIAHYEIKYKEIEDYVNDSKHPFVKDTISMIFKHNILPMTPLKDALFGFKDGLKVYGCGDTKPSFEYITPTYQECEGSAYNSVVSEKTSDDPLFLVARNKHRRPTLYYKVVGEEMRKQQDLVRYSVQTKSEFMNFRNTPGMAKDVEALRRENENIDEHEIIHILTLTSEDREIFEILKINKVFCLYYPMSRNDYVIAIPETQRRESMIGYLYTELREIEERKPITTRNLLDYVQSHKLQDGYEITPWELGLNLNRTKFCDHYLSLLGITRLEYDNCFVTSGDYEYVNDGRLHAIIHRGINFTDAKKHDKRGNPVINARAANGGELLPSRINWRGEGQLLKGWNYGRDHCTANTCACFHASQAMLKNLSIKFENNVTHYDLEKIKMYGIPIPIELEPLGTLCYEPTRVRRRFLKVNRVRTCMTCGHPLNSEDCKRECGLILDKRMITTEKQMSSFIKLLSDIKDKEYQTISDREKLIRTQYSCLHCALYINFVDFGISEPYTYNDAYLGGKFFGDQILVRTETFLNEQHLYFGLYDAILSLPNLRVKIQQSSASGQSPDHYMMLFSNSMFDYVHEKNDSIIYSTERKINIEIRRRNYYDELRKKMNIVIETNNYLCGYTDLTELREYKRVVRDAPCYMCEIHQKVVNQLRYNVHKSRTGDPGYDRRAEWGEQPDNAPLDETLEAPDANPTLSEFEATFGEALVTGINKLNDSIDYQKIYGPSIGAEITTIANNMDKYQMDDDYEF